MMAPNDAATMPSKTVIVFSGSRVKTCSRTSNKIRRWAGEAYLAVFVRFLKVSRRDAELLTVFRGLDALCQGWVFMCKRPLRRTCTVDNRRC
jgi:hypothetical protein